MMGARVSATIGRKDSKGPNDFKKEASCSSQRSSPDCEGSTPSGPFELEKDDAIDLPPCRHSLAHMLKSRIVDTSVNLLVLTNLILVVTETDAQSLGNETPAWVVYTNYVMLGIFFTELSLRLFVYRLAFFCHTWNIMDFAVVSIDVIGFVVQIVGGDVPSMSVLRIFRLARLCRGVKVIRMFPKLALLVQGCFAAASSILWGMGLVAIIVLMWSILAVNVIHPLAKDVTNAGGFDGCARCPTAYETVGASMITILQANIAGDSWGLTTIPIIESFPHSFLFFGGCFMTVQVALLNVILATIVESALKASENNTKMVLDSKEAAKRDACRHMMHICQEIDTDGSGSLTKSEFKRGIDSHQEFGELLKSMDVSAEDFDIVFQILDNDGSGSVSYREFIEELHKMKAHDAHTMLVFINFYIMQIRDKVCEQLQLVKHDILGHLRQVPGATQDLPDDFSESKLSSMKLDEESGFLDAPTKSGTQDDEGGNEMKCPKARRSAADDFEVVSEQLCSIRDVIQKDLVQRLVDISCKFDTVLDGGPDNNCNSHQRRWSPSGAGSNEQGTRSSAWRTGPQQAGRLREAGNTGAAGGQRSFRVFGCEVAERALPQTLSTPAADGNL